MTTRSLDLPKSLSRRVLLQGTLAGAATSLVPAAARAAEPAYAKWFRYGPTATASWRFSEVEGDPMQVVIRQASATGPVKRVMVLYPRPSSAYDIAITEILEVFESRDVAAVITVVNFNIEDARGEAALRRAEAEKFDLIFSMGSESTAWLHERYRGHRVPVVSVCSKDPVQLGQMTDYDGGSGTNFAYTSLNMPIDVQMAYLLELKPRLKNLAVLVDSKNISAVQTQAGPIIAYAGQRSIRALDVAVKDPASARLELARLVHDAVVTMRKSDPDLSNSVFLITGSTAVFREIATINAHADRAAVLSMVPEVVNAGDDSAVLSIGISFESNARLAGIYGADVLSGRVAVGELKVGIVTPPDIAINFRRARKIGMRIPFRFFESASFVYDYDGRMVRNNGKTVAISN